MELPTVAETIWSVDEGRVVPMPTPPAVKEIAPVEDAQKRLLEMYFRFAIKLPVELAETADESNVPAIES